jgi:phage terminase small subunit
MAGTGRKPFETTDVVSFGAGNQRLRPPPSLGEPEKQAFIDLVTTTDPKQFRPSDLPLLCRWAELTVMAEQAAGELQAGGMVTADGRVSPWFTIHQQATKSLTGLALRLRLGPQSRAPRAPKTKAATISYYERMTLEGVSRDASEGDDS